MYPSISNNYQKGFSSTPPPSATPVSSNLEFDQSLTVTGTPVNQSNPPCPNTCHSPVPWSTGICNCCDDINSCCLTCWCPCVTFGRIAEMADRGSTSCGVSAMVYTFIMCFTGCPCLYSCFYRSKLRGQYFLQESPCTDCCIHCCCEECSLCQEYRELQNHGFDMSIGWHANMERQRLAPLNFPAVEGGMLR